MHIFIGSSNPVKIEATRLAALPLWPELTVNGYEVETGVPEQPRSDADTRLGAENRATKAMAQGLTEHPELAQPNAGEQPSVLGVGMEGGVFQSGHELWATVWAAVADPSGRLVVANGSRFVIPPEIAAPILAGGEMGPVVSQLANVPDLRKKQGMIGLVTNNHVTRTEEYSNIIKMAIGLWYGQSQPWQSGIHYA